MISATIVDDEPYSCEALVTLLERHCPEIRVIDICHSATAAIVSMTAHPPDLLFLDIEMPHKNGFELLEELSSIGFDLIFTTSYDQYAIRAIRFSALDYLLKPIDAEELKSAVQKVMLRRRPPEARQIELLLERYTKPSGAIRKIAIPTLEGLEMIPIDTIISCASSRNYTVFQLKGGRKLTASRSLKDVEEMLEDHAFVRVHHSFIVNLNEIEKYVRGEGGHLIMSDRSTIDVSRSRKEILLNRLQRNRK